jgi:TolB-like protein/AraC-like DNA-binding protein/uncharacterized protein YozE (UPF0346 family)
MLTELSIDQELIEKLDNLIELNLENEKFSVEDLATGIGKSRSQLHRKLHAINGKSTSQYIREYRLKKAMKMLQKDVATASEIAYRVGFGSPSYFNTCFHDYYGYPPGEVKFRNSYDDHESGDIDVLNENTDTITLKKWYYNFRTNFISTLIFCLVITFAFAYYKYNNSDNVSTTNLEKSNTVANSIAVLPFQNMRGGMDDEAFCDGMTSAIISRLSKIKGIDKVISHTSMMNYKGNKKDMPEIADELNVHYILESGFQKSGNNIKINLQLIDGPSDKLYWSQVYEGKYDSIFKIQAEVAEMVANQLDANITKDEQISIQKSLTYNTEAYENYLMGNRIFNSWANNNLEASRRYFEKAIELDSTFSEAYYYVGLTYSLLGIWSGNMTKTVANELAKPYYDRAPQLDSDNYELLNYLAFDASFDWNFKKADSLYEKLSNIGYEHFRDGFYFMMGNNDRIIENYFNMLEGPIKEEDYTNINWSRLPYALYYRGAIDEATHLMEVGLRRRPNFDEFYDHFGNIYLAMGDFEKAKDVLETGLIISKKRYASMVIHLAIVYHYLGDEAKSKELLNEAIDRANYGEPEINVFVAHYFARMGNHDQAFKWLDIAYKNREVDLVWLKSDPNLILLKADPRYKTLCKKIGFLNVK